MPNRFPFNKKQVFLLGLVFVLLFIFSDIQMKKIIEENEGKNLLEGNLIFPFKKQSMSITVEKEPRFLDGILVPKKEKNFLPIAAMIDNFPQARPANSLEKASVVYEAPVEAGITRFLAIFDSNSLPDKIGPIRSARPYFADWAEEYRSLFIHAGGSPEVIKKLKQNYYQVYNLDDLSQASIYFERDQSKIAPFNLFISREKVIGFLDDRKIVNQGNFDPWLFLKLTSSEQSEHIRTPRINLTNGNQPTEVKTSQIKINFKEPVIWQYDLETNSYLRIQQDNNKVGVKNLLIQITDISVIDEVGRRQIRTEGKGEAIIFQNGETISGYWQKLTKNQRTRFYSLDGQEIRFNPGLLWIEVVGGRSWIEF